jgi:hypothetical protein
VPSLFVSKDKYCFLLHSRWPPYQGK